MLSSSVLFFALAPILALCAIALIAFFMRTRRFYFIRHGETLPECRAYSSGLRRCAFRKRKKAVRQSRPVSKTFPHQSCPIEHLPACERDLKNHREASHCAYQVLPLTHRAEESSEIIGKHRDDTEVVRIVDHIDHSYHADDYRFSDEENFVDLKQRARTCLSFLAWHGTRETVVVTHHVFLKILIAYLLYRERLHADGFAKLSFFNYSDNASITVCEFHPWKILNATHGWEVVSYNEQP